MSKTKIGGILFFCIIAAFSNCKKPDTKRDYVDLDIDSAVKARLNFLPGTYWIYKDASTGRVDSFYVRSNEYQDQMETYVVYKYHIITIAQVNIDGTAPADSANWVFDYRSTKIVANYNYTTFDYGWKNQILFEPLFLYPYSFGDIKGKNDTAAITMISDTMNINGLHFDRVAEVYHFSDDGSVSSGIVNRTRLTDWFYVNDSVGMIRMVIDHWDHDIHHDWGLIRYNIVR